MEYLSIGREIFSTSEVKFAKRKVEGAERYLAFRVIAPCTYCPAAAQCSVKFGNLEQSRERGA